jgi:putative addiction module component (TIGR02574 family)
MTRVELEREILLLPVDERLELAETIWASVEDQSPQAPLPAWQRELLAERIAEDDAAPEAGSSWDEVKRRILSTL